MGYILLLIIGILFLRGHDFLSKVVGVILVCVAVNPLVTSLTGRSVVGNIKSVVHLGDKTFNGLNDSLKGVREKVKGD